MLYKSVSRIFTSYEFYLFPTESPFSDFIKKGRKHHSVMFYLALHPETQMIGSDACLRTYYKVKDEDFFK